MRHYPLIASPLFCILLFLLPSPVKAEPANEQIDPFNSPSSYQSTPFWTNGTLSLGLEALAGHNTYQIGDPTIIDATGAVQNDYFPFSELEFPLDVVMFSAALKFTIKERFIFGITAKTDVVEPNDDMIDKDWITTSNPSRLDIYSNSTIKEFEAYEWDFQLLYKIINSNKGSLYLGNGYKHQNWYWDAVLLHQYSPSGLPGYDYTGSPGDSSCILYEIDYDIPYVQVGGDLLLGKSFALEMNVAYSPWLKAQDKDQHVCRTKVNEGDLKGDYYMGNLQFSYHFGPGLSVSSGYQYTFIEADGRMTGRFPLTPSNNHSVQEEVESEQHALFFKFSYQAGSN